jgi:prolyl-tRNA synthetase
MGCYGIGITRLVAAAIEQHHDDRGIVWPVEVAPYQVEVLALGSDGAVASTASGIHDGLEAAGLDVLVDDRQERPGVKFFDADLIGAPVRIVVGEKGIGKGTVELKSRDGTLAEDVEPARASSRALEVVEGMRREAMDRAAERASTILHETGLHK